MKTNRLLTAIFATGLLAAVDSKAQDAVPQITINNGNLRILTSGQPAPDHYGPAPSFAQLDTNHDGFISRDEAEAYPPLFNDFDFPAQLGNRITRQQFETWNRTQNR